MKRKMKQNTQHFFPRTFFFPPSTCLEILMGLKGHACSRYGQFYILVFSESNWQEKETEWAIIRLAVGKEEGSFFFGLCFRFGNLDLDRNLDKILNCF